MSEKLVCRMVTLGGISVIEWFEREPVEITGTPVGLQEIADNIRLPDANAKSISQIVEGDEEETPEERWRLMCEAFDRLRELRRTGRMYRTPEGKDGA